MASGIFPRGRTGTVIVGRMSLFARFAPRLQPIVSRVAGVAAPGTGDAVLDRRNVAVLEQAHDLLPGQLGDPRVWVMHVLSLGGPS